VDWQDWLNINIWPGELICQVKKQKTA